MSKKETPEWGSALMNNYGTPNITIARGKGITLWDTDGRKYLDFLGGIATNILGHNHPKIVEAITEQAGTLSHISNLYSHLPGLKLASKLKELSGDDSARIFFCNSGAEANEAAIKISRLTGRKKIIATIDAFHGRTMGALTLTGQESKRLPFQPLLKGVKHVRYGDGSALKSAITGRTAMVIIEPILGEAGVITPPPGYLRRARELCDEKGVLLAFDCVQTGMGRTGSWFGFEHEDIKPDIITLAKGLGAGLPMGAVIALGNSSQLLGPGSHGSTFGGNPIISAAANAMIAEIERKNYLTLNSTKGALLRNLLSSIEGVTQVRGRGLLIGISLRDQSAKKIAQELEKRGFLVNAANDETIRLAPAFIVTEKEILLFVATFAQICEEVYRG